MTENLSTLVFFVNGKKIVDGEVDPEWTLLQYLRNKLRLCGTKLGCGEGGCGACTVMVSKYDRARNKVVHIPVNSCLAPVCSMHGLAVTTVEGIGSTKTKLHPVQERIAKAHGSQCGFCTPGIVMSMYSLLRSKPKPSMEDLETTLQGNLCRCTGYRAIIEGYRTFTEAGPVSNGCPMGDKCCKVNGGGKGEQEEEELFDSREFLPYDPSQEAIFPPELKVSDVLDRQSLHFKGPNVHWFRPLRLAELLELKDKHLDAKIVVGNSEVGVEVKFRHFDYPVRVSPTHIPEMTGWKLDGDHVTFGASITLQEMQDVLQDLVNTETKRGTAVFKAIVDMLHWFAGKQIRSVASVGGNIMTGSPISDLNPIFMAAQVRLHLESLGGGRRSVVMDHGFFTGYRKNIVGAKEVVVAISVPFTKPSQHFHAYKQARRRDDDIAIVNSAMNVTFAPNTTVIEDITLAFGGMAATTVMPLKTQQKLVGKDWNRKTLEQCYAYLLEDLPLEPSAPGGMVSYRQTLALSLFFRAFLKVATKLGIDLDRRELSAVEGFHYVPPKSSQYFQVVPETQERTDSVGRPLVHVSAFKQAAGEAIYCDDIPRFENELYMAFVYSTEAYAEILSVDATEALRSDRVHGFLSAEDLSPEQNSVGPVFHDEEVFVSKTVTSRGQIIAAILAEDQESAQRAARKVKVTYKRLQPVIVTIDDAIEHKSFYPKSLKKIENGDVDRALGDADHVLEGDCRTGYQEHFYFETHSVVVNPKKEDNELDIYSSTQHPSEINSLVAHVLQIPQNRISTKVKRLGGGFGGKESRGAVIAVPAAIAASKYNRPVRIMLDRDEDMAMSGGRHPFLLKYKVGFDKEGKISAADVHIYNNAGYSHDLSIAVLERALFHVENAYKIPNVRVSGYCCKTNLPSNTAFRGFGGPQGMFAAETMVRHIADFLGKDELEVSELNLYKEGDVTHYNQTLTYCTLQRCWRECLDGSDYERRKADIAEYNRENRWKKRGISVVPTKFGIAFTIPTLNQAGALILIYQDGSVLLTHGGTEMGQGLHTKMIQVASRTLSIPPEKIHITETATDKVPNTSATAASAGSDLNGMAVLNACKTINERLEPIKKKLPKGTWEEWIKAAYMERISLSATGFYKTPDIGYSFETNTGMAFNYYTYGAAVSEVEIDCLTGDHRVLRTDIVMDLGESLNPAIDIGQVEGGFMQGYGLFVMEEMMYSPTGVIFTKGPGAYKIPGFGDIPIEFNVSLLKGAPNPRAVYSSKAVGEPPLFLASSVLFAIKDAIKAARKDAGISGYFKLDAPATAAKIRMNCVDNLTDMIKEPIPGTYTPWNVIP